MYTCMLTSSSMLFCKSLPVAGFVEFPCSLAARSIFILYLFLCQLLYGLMKHDDDDDDDVDDVDDDEDECNIRPVSTQLMAVFHFEYWPRNFVIILGLFDMIYRICKNLCQLRSCRIYRCDTIMQIYTTLEEIKFFAPHLRCGLRLRFTKNVKCIAPGCTGPCS
jgi:hypothetical protein